jgi:hypothetical protein
MRERKGGIYSGYMPATPEMIAVRTCAMIPGNMYTPLIVDEAFFMAGK